MSSRYEPRRRVQRSRPGARPAGAHRQVRQRSRLGLFALALGITVLVGAAGFGLFPRLEGGTSASADVTAATALENAGIEILEPVVVKAPKDDKADLAAKVAAKSDALPASSGVGKRVVFSQSEQRVWLVDATGKVFSTYRVSGSKLPNLNPGTYAVQSHTLHATAYDYASHMDYFVRFTTGKNAPIGFHDIPVSNTGQYLQTTAQLGTPLSSGCVRQYRPDAIRLWTFAPVG
ncbi:MAG: L,D-transpeptidase, partial [Aeromicrobium sp.]